MPGKDLVAELINALGSKRVDKRRHAMRQLALMGAEAVRALMRVLRKGDAQQRYSAALILGKIRASEALPALVTAMKDKNVQVRGNAALALGEFGGADAVDALINGLQDKEWWGRSCAAEALGWISDKRAIRPLAMALQREIQEEELSAKESADIMSRHNPAEQQYAVRPTIIEAIRRIGGKEAQSVLRKLGVSVQGHRPRGSQNRVLP